MKKFDPDSGIQENDSLNLDLLADDEIELQPVTSKKQGTQKAKKHDNHKHNYNSD